MMKYIAIISVNFELSLKLGRTQGEGGFQAAAPTPHQNLKKHIL